MSVSQTEKMSTLKIPSSSRTPYVPKYSSAIKDRTQFSTLKANEIFLDAWLKIPDQSLPVSQLTSQHLPNKLWYRENSVPIVKCSSGPPCSSSTSVIHKNIFPGESKESKSPPVSPREEEKTKDSKTETDSSGEKNLLKSGVRPRIRKYSNGVHTSNSGFVSQQERAKSTLEKIMRKRIYEKERYKNGGISPRVSENLWDFETNFIMASIQPISQRGGQRLRNNHHSRNNFQDRFILRNTNIKWNLPNTLTCLDNLDQQQPPHSGGVAFKDFKILPLPSPGLNSPMTDSHFARKILGSSSLTVRNYWKPGPSHIKIT